MNRLKFILQHRYFIKLLTLLFLIFICFYIRFIDKKNVKDNNIKNLNGIIYKIKETNNYYNIYIKSSQNFMVKINKEKYIKLELGDTINVEGEKSEIYNNTIPNLFNYSKYLYYNNVNFIIEANNIKIIRKNTNFIYYIRNKILSRIAKIKKSSNYINTFLLGDNSNIDKEYRESYVSNGISHLFSISGMHLSLFTMIFLFILNRVSYNKRLNSLIVFIFLLFYVLLIGCSVSSLRSLIMFALFSLNNIYNLKIKKLDIMLLLLDILLFINPYYIFNVSFQFSFLISFFLVLYSDKIKSKKNYLKRCLYISFLSFLVSFPICVCNYYQVNILSIFLNVIFVPLISIIVFPLSIITFIFPILDNVLYFFIQIIEYLSIFFQGANFGTIIFSKINYFLIIIYYIFLMIFLKNNKYIFIFFYIIFWKLYPIFNYDHEIYFLDVSQGDSTVIKYPNDKLNILIDTGGLLNSDYSIVINKTIPFLKSIGIFRIDYLILTHGDYDHMGDAINFVNNFRVDSVVLNCGEFNDLEKDLINVLNMKKIKYYRCIKELNINDNKLYFLNNKIYDNENDNSIVLYTKINEKKFLFMGDSSIKTERDILQNYNLNNIDFLKVGHHGSKTSSSREFINKINPKYSVISVGKNNRYGHPNDQVLDILEESKIYRTDKDGSVIIKLNRNKLNIKECKP